MPAITKLKKGQRVRIVIPRGSRRARYSGEAGTIARISKDEADADAPFIVELLGNCFVGFSESELVVLSDSD